MKLVYVLDYIFFRTPDGVIWTDTSYSADFWNPYLALYDAVTVVSRVTDVPEVVPGWKKANGHRVEIHPVPVYRSLMQFLQKRRSIQASLKNAFKQECAITLRIPSNLSRVASSILLKSGRPFFVDVVGDPADALAPGVVSMKGRAFFRLLFTLSQRRICRSASGVSYVAQRLKDRYPSKPTASSLVCSDVRLSEEWISDSSRTYAERPLRLITVATLTQTYKGIDTLLHALRICHDAGTPFELRIVGSGRYQSTLEQLAVSLGLSGSVSFLGSIPWGTELIQQLDQAELFVLPSRVEVMPRALLEAMARGLPCVATTVGAVAEVLEGLYRVPANSPQLLAKKLMQVAADPLELDHMSAANLQMAKRFASAHLMQHWNAYHRACIGQLCDISHPSPLSTAAVSAL